MSQTTRCPSCATLFKIVPDQLRISDGWVRCGHCKQVFDASQSLQTLVTEPLLRDLSLDHLRAPPLRNRDDERSDVLCSPVQVSASVAPDAVPRHHLASPASDERALQVPEPGMPAFLAATNHFERDVTRAAAESEGTPSFAPNSVPSPAPAPAPEAADLGEQPALAEADAFDVVAVRAVSQKPAGYELPAAVLPEPDLDWLEDGSTPESGAEVVTEAETDEPLRRAWDSDADAIAGDAPNSSQVEGDTAGASDDADRPNRGSDEASEVPEETPLEEIVLGTAPEPSFVRAARRQALWRKPAVRTVLWLLVLMLTAALLLQVTLAQRNYMAAAWPQSRPYLEMACSPLQCRVGAYRDISSVVVDSSSFDKLRGNAHQFVITLKNRSDMELEMPAVELTLTDADSQPVLRRVFTLSDLSAPATLAARGEWAASLPAQLAPLDSARIAGYRVLAFYP